MTLTEKIARAMCGAGGFDPDEIMPNDGPRWKYYVDAAQAALTAISEYAGDGVQRVDREAATNHRDRWERGMAGKEQTAEMFAQHRALAIAAERARVVAKLRQCRSNKLAHHREVCFTEDDEILDAIITAAQTFEYAADAIERGEV